MLRGGDLSKTQRDGDTAVVVRWQDGERPLMDGDQAVLVRAAIKRERDYLDYAIDLTLGQWGARPKETAAP